MRINTVHLGFAFLISFYSIYVLAAEQLDYCPAPTKSYTLKSGQKVELPFCADRSNYVSLVTLADIHATDRLLQPLHLHSVPIRGRALVTLAAIEYQRSVIGHYREFILAVMAAPIENLAGDFLRFFEFSSLNPSAPPKSHGQVVLKLWVDSPLALATGNEIWGFNKSLAHIEISPGNGFRITDPSYKLILQSAWRTRFALPVPRGHSMKFFAIPASGRWVRAQYQGDAWLSVLTGDEVLEFGSDPWGQKMSSLAINSLFAWSAPSFSLQMFSN